MKHACSKCLAEKTLGLESIGIDTVDTRNQNKRGACIAAANHRNLIVSLEGASARFFLHRESAVADSLSTPPL